ncbi:hypothetical protein PtA15_12A110 [Puccinia triticina]|uniref:Uncharacterized protein n=1 Tax=Puccinia triticina TaxID=208348 RepID=A0ABY7D294_9BASI|nr:uncharacterized protein PtA15_12A110 [Puccinia triticina]WAQ90125.1 hypothetical protein PtA15_12A110 [Puccinia triticina]
MLHRHSAEFHSNRFAPLKRFLPTLASVGGVDEVASIRKAPRPSPRVEPAGVWLTSKAQKERSRDRSTLASGEGRSHGVPSLCLKGASVTA